MLSETFIASSSSPPKLTSANSTLLKDAGIFVHSFQPQPGLRSTFKKSVTAPNCLAISDSHLFAAQSEKAVVHIYSRQKGNQEATVPFPERINSLTLAVEDTVLVLGTEGGSVILWETCTGRQLSTPQSHLQAVTALAVDSSSNFLLSGSSDSNLLVWSLLDLLSFPSSLALAQQEPIEPRHTLAAHRSAITSITIGHSATCSNIAISASRDNTAIVWDYHTGERLRTFLFHSTPLCTALDPADRAFYAGFEDGTVQLIDFYPSSKSGPNTASIRDISHASTPVQPPSSSLWTPPFPEIGSTLSISLSHDGTTLLSTHSSGKILSWDISHGAFRTIVADYPAAPITNLLLLPPTGFPNQKPPPLKFASVIKPRPHEPFSSAKGQLSEKYAFTAQFQEGAATPAPQIASSLAFTSPLFPSDLIASSIAELITWDTLSSSAQATPGLQQAADFLPLNLDGAIDSPATPDIEVSHLRQQVAHLKNLQTATSKQIERMTREAQELRKLEAEREERRRKKARTREIRAVKEWEKLGVNGAGGGSRVAEMDMDIDGEEEEDSATSSSEELSTSEDG